MIARVWAPHATRVDLDRDGAREPMRPVADGWWEGSELAPGERYGFALDGGPTRPDPRGRALPDGVHSLSEARAVPREPVPTPGWRGRDLADAVLYELHIGTFTPAGTLDAAIEQLDHLVRLGIDAVELLPVGAFNGEYGWGYDGVAWFAVHAPYGGPDAYLRFVEAAHAHGLAVIQDVVYNHLGPSGNYLPEFGPYLHEHRTTWGETLNLDEPEVRRYILDNAALWFEEYGVDGLRLDAVHALEKRGAPRLLTELAAETRERAERLGRPLWLIAESDLNDPVMFTGREAGGYGLTAQWSDDYHHAVHVALTGETQGYYADFAPLSALGIAATRGFFHAGTYSSFRERPHGRTIPPEAEAWRLVTFTQNHDQIGNRAAGDRLTAQLSEERLSIAAVLTVLSPSTPMLFMGEEWAASTPWPFFSSHPEPELAAAVEAGRIEEFARMGWNPDEVARPQDPVSFARAHLDWSELAAPFHARMLERYRTLIALRRREPELHSPRFAELTGSWDDAARTIALARGSITIRVNLGTEHWRAGPAEQVLFTTTDTDPVMGGELVLPPDSAVVSRR
ncbi:MAG: malto-oligosyltrehalose trehalohydrolase [Protaetiibacter sp.]